MGGAGIAFGSDSAMPYINPAGITRVPGNVLSLSLNVYNQARYRISDFYIPGSVDTSTSELGSDYNYEQEYLVSSEFSGFPGSLCYFIQLGSGVAHFSVIVPHYERKAFEGGLRLSFTDTSFGGSAEFRIRDSVIFQRTEYYIGPGYGINMGDLRLGASAFILYRTMLNSVDNTSLVTTDMAGIPYYLNSTTSGYSEGDSFSFAPICGLQYEISTGLSLGISLALPALHLYGSYKMAARGQGSNPDQFGSPDWLEIQRGEGELMHRKPMKLRTGFGFQKPNKWSLAIDIDYIFKKNNTLGSDVTYKIWYYENERPMNYSEEYINAEFETSSAINVYLGGEYYLNTAWVLRAGVFMLQTTTPELDTESGSDLFTLRLQRYGASIGLGNITKAGETNYGLIFIYGSGETVTQDIFSDLNKPDYLANPEYTTVNVNHYMIAFFVSGSVDFSGM